jgi:hypothetical protein
MVGVMQGAGMGGTEMTWSDGSDPQPEEPDDGYPDSLWPDDDGSADDWPQAAGRPARVRGADPADAPVPWRRAVPPAGTVPPAATGARDGSERRGRIVTLVITGVLAVGLGAGAVAVYRSAQPGTPPVAAASPGTGPGATTEIQVEATVTAVGPGTITIGGRAAQSVTATVTSATRFTGSVRTLAGVRVGDTVVAQIVVANGVGRVLTLQDPASDS